MKKKTVCLAILGLAIAFAVWMLWPRSFTAGLRSDDTAKCFLNNRIVKISGGRKSTEKLCEELAAALRAS